MGFFQGLFGGRKRVIDDDWQLPIVQEICVAMINQVPSDWNCACLLLEPPEAGIGNGLAHSAITAYPATDFLLRDDQFITARMEVMAATRKLELGWVERKRTFKRATITAIRDGEEWKFGSDYVPAD